MVWKVPLFDTDIGPEEIDAVTRVLKSGWLTMGEETKAFEEEFAAFIGVKYAFMVSNCTAALYLAHIILGASNDAEVVCPSLTFVATANSIIQTGARPVFADITSLDYWNISPEDIERKITQQTRGITVVHYAGWPCEMDEIIMIAREHGLYVVEDCAHSVGASYKRKMTGTIGDIGCFSFFSNKNLSTGEGGMVVTDRDDIAERIILLRSHGMTTLTLDRYKGHAFTYDVVAFGFNYRSSEINAAIGRVQLKKLISKNRRREEIAMHYNKYISQVEGISPPFQCIDTDIRPTYYIYPVLLDNGIDRDKIMDNMKQKGVQTSIHYRPIHTFSVYNPFARKYQLPLTDELRERILTLPLFPTMTDEQIHYVLESLAASI
jgi:dTDP-4-amino-4,6-dideoxygalactose transaminase